MPEDDGRAAPAPFGKFFVVDGRAVMRVDDEAVDPDRQEMVHGVGDNGTAVQGKERLGAMLRQRPEPGPQARAENKGRLEPAPFQ